VSIDTLGRDEHATGLVPDRGDGRKQYQNADDPRENNPNAFDNPAVLGSVKCCAAADDTRIRTSSP